MGLWVVMRQDRTGHVCMRVCICVYVYVCVHSLLVVLGVTV